MQSKFTRIPNAFGGDSTVVEHVSLDDVIAAWDAAFERAGMDPTTPAAVAALRHLLDKAGVLTLSTWGQVCKVEQAREDLTRALAEFGVGAPAQAPIGDRVVH